MTNHRRTASPRLSVLLALGLIFVGGESFARYPEYVRTACKQDFRKFCRSYDEESAALRQCIRRVADDLSRKCQDALERSGERRGRR